MINDLDNYCQTSFQKLVFILHRLKVYILLWLFIADTTISDDYVRDLCFRIGSYDCSSKTKTKLVFLFIKCQNYKVTFRRIFF